MITAKEANILSLAGEKEERKQALALITNLIQGAAAKGRTQVRYPYPITPYLEEIELAGYRVVLDTQTVGATIYWGDKS
jgi:hypothetical protein